MLIGKAEVVSRLGKTVVIEPYRERNLGSAQYDVTLGEHFWRDSPKSGGCVFNPFHEGPSPFPRTVANVADRFEAGRLSYVWYSPDGTPYDPARYPAVWDSTDKSFFREDLGHRWLPGIGDAPVMMIHPGESLLCHTEEFIGGRRDVTTSMRARSSYGRIGISVCLCAGLGDVGYFNRWTMEIRNHSSYRIPLVPGRRVGQLQFWCVGDQGEAAQYHADGKYQAAADVEELRRNWKPEDMLPRLWRDREVRAGNVSGGAP